jgi:enamine deaminase RidA (YjgF/YER057c/UK114 family)
VNRISDFADSVQHTTAGPYSPLLKVTAGDIVVLSGQGPLDDRGDVVGDDIRDQLRVTLDNCARQLARAGLGLRSVFKVNAYLSDLAHWNEFNEEYLRHFSAPLPVRTTVGVQLLLGMKVELDIWAAR